MKLRLKQMMIGIQRGTTRRAKGRRERGAALITTLLCMTLLYALALALLLSTTTDTLISGSYKASEEAFFAADAGIAVGRRAIRSALATQIQLIANNPARAYNLDSQVLPDSTSAPSAAFFQAVKQQTLELANAEKRSRLPNDSQYQIDILAFEGGPTGNPIRNPRNGLESYAFTYTIRSRGRSASGAYTEVVERGLLQTQLTASAKPTRQPYSTYGTFFDRGDPDGGLVLVSGTFTGPVHTNSHFSFSSDNTVTFKGKVTQADDYIIYDGASEPIPPSGKDGILVSENAYRRDKSVPLPQNNYQQEIAVLNGSGYSTDIDPEMLDGNGRATADALANFLSDAKGSPDRSGGDIAPGVYIASSDSASVTGGGIYVNGDAEIQLSTVGANQVFEIKVGASTSTVTIDYTAQTTTLTTGGSSRTFTGVPTDTTLGQGNKAHPGISLFVDGSIKALSGPPAVDGQTAPAISSQTAMTITAQRNIRITGDLKYADPVVGPDGSPLPGANQVESALGIFTNDGNIELAPDGVHSNGNNLSLEIHAAMAAFNAKKNNDGDHIEGAILFAPGMTLPRSARLTIVGARLQSNIANIKYRNRAVYYDPRFAGGNFAPPFFPGVEVKSDNSNLTITFPGEQAVSIQADGWQRDERRHKDE